MRISFAHIRGRAASSEVDRLRGIRCRVVTAGGDTANGALLVRLTAAARRLGLKVDQSALAYREGGSVGFYGTRALVDHLSRAGVPNWTHYLEILGGFDAEQGNARLWRPPRRSRGRLGNSGAGRRSGSLGSCRDMYPQRGRRRGPTGCDGGPHQVPTIAALRIAWRPRLRWARWRARHHTHCLEQAAECDLAQPRSQRIRGLAERNADRASVAPRRRGDSRLNRRLRLTSRPRRRDAKGAALRLAGRRVPTGRAFSCARVPQIAQWPPQPGGESAIVSPSELCTDFPQLAKALDAARHLQSPL